MLVNGKIEKLGKIGKKCLHNGFLLKKEWDRQPFLPSKVGIMDTVFFSILSFLSPLPAIRRVPEVLRPWLWYVGCVLLVGWMVQVFVPVLVILCSLVALFIVNGCHDA